MYRKVAPGAARSSRGADRTAAAAAAACRTLRRVTMAASSDQKRMLFDYASARARLQAIVGLVRDPRCDRPLRIVAIHERTASLASPMRNADMGYEERTASIVAVVTDVVRAGRPVVGYGFDSIGR